MHFGDYIRKAREACRVERPELSLRLVAREIGVEPAYLSKIERGVFAPPSEAVIVKLAQVLGEDPDLLLAMAGKLSTDLQQVILARPALLAELLRHLRDVPDHAVLRLVREVRDGDW